MQSELSIETTKMGHNVSSNKIVVSQAKDSDSVAGKRAGNGNIGALLREQRIDSTVPCFTRIGECNVKVKEDDRMCNITGCCVLPDGCFILTDYSNKRLKRVNKKQVSFIDINDHPTDVCYLGKSENKAVVCGGQTIYFVNIMKGSMKLSRSVSLDHVCSGITSHGDNLYIIDDTSVLRYTISGERTDLVYNSPNSKFNHVAVSANGTMLYITDENSGLTTIDRSGKLLGIIMHNDLRGAQGVCVGHDGNVLVCGFESDTVIKVDGSGKKRLGTVIQDNGDLSDPKSLCVDNQNSKLYVGQWNDKLTVFKIK